MSRWNDASGAVYTSTSQSRIKASNRERATWTLHQPLSPSPLAPRPQMMGIVRFSPALLADNLDQVLPRGWKGEKFVGWGGGTAGGPGGPGGESRGPKAAWLALFWSEVSLLDVASVPGLGQWPLVPITTGELVSCSLLQQVWWWWGPIVARVRACVTVFRVLCAGMGLRSTYRVRPRLTGYGQ